MPYLQMEISGIEVHGVTNKVVDALTSLTTDILDKKHDLIAIVVNYFEEHRWAVGGISVELQGLKTFFLDIRVTHGTNTKEQKADYVQAVFQVMQTILGELHPASYVVIQDVDADSWGYGGMTQEFRSINRKST